MYNEEGNLTALFAAIKPVLALLDGESEVIFIDDGSRDAGYAELAQLALTDARVKVIKFARNFGQTAAMSAGFHHAKGEIIIPMDADMQNDPTDIPRLILKLKEGYDVVSGWRKDRQDESIRTIPSKLANKLIARVTGVNINDYGCSLKAYRREVLEGVHLYGEMHRFIPAYAAWNGGKVTEIEVRHHPRTVGSSKYNLSRTFKVILDLLVVKFLTTYFARPMHFFGMAGFLSIFLGGFVGLYAVYLKLFFDVSFIQTPLPLLTVFLWMLAVQFVLLGIIGEMLTRTYFESQHKSTYRVADTINM